MSHISALLEGKTPIAFTGLKMPKFKIMTLGCKVNQSESDTIARQLECSNWRQAAGGETSQICIINTCAVTQKASMQSRQAVRRAIRANPNSRIIVTGCYAQTDPDALKNIDGVTDIIGNTDKPRILEVVDGDSKAASGHAISFCHDAGKSQKRMPSPHAVCGTRTRPFLKIQDGCNAFCTYCIVPYARGPSRSLPLEAVLEAFKSWSNAGYHEIVLTGVHLGQYGRDLEPQTHLCQLLEQLERLQLPPRVRLSSIEPLELTDDLIARVAKSGGLCRHFHIPLQSGDDSTLRRMKRPYTADRFRQLISNIRKQIPDAAIGVDTLIGFPGETDAAFENTYELISELPITYLHVFPFSARPGTPAAGYRDRVAPDKIKKRCERMRRLGDAKRGHFHQHFIGKEIEIVVESTRHAATGLLKGLSSNYIPVYIDADDGTINRRLTVLITDHLDNALMGTIVIENI